MKPLVLPIAAALGLLAFGAADAQTAADPLACARTADGTAIRIGTEVLDAKGQRIGAVSITQCTRPAGAAAVKVSLDAAFGGEVKAVPLTGATATNAAVHLSQTAEEIAAIPPVAQTAPPPGARSGG